MQRRSGRRAAAAAAATLLAVLVAAALPRDGLALAPHHPAAARGASLRVAGASAGPNPPAAAAAQPPWRRHDPAAAVAAAAAAAAAASAAQRPAQPPRRRPLVIAHRGASGLLPEHTAAAYLRAIEDGADFIECDVQLTADLEMVCRHEQNLNETTDALEKFPDRVRTYTIDGEVSTGVHAIDLTLAELRALRARQRFPFRPRGHDGAHGLVTFQEFLGVAAAAPRVVGVYPEVKHPSWHNALPALAGGGGPSIQARVVAALHAAGYGRGRRGGAAWAARPVFVQRFELGALRDMAALTAMPLVLLLGGWPGYRAPDSGLTHEEMTSPEALAEAALYVSGAGPWKGSLWAAGSAGSAGGGQQAHAGGLSPDAAHDAALAGSPSERLVSSGLAARLRAAGLEVHPYTLRDEPAFVPAQLGGDVEAELSALFESEGVDGVFADYPATAAAWVTRHCGAAAAGEAPAARHTPGGGVAMAAEGPRPWQRMRGGGARLGAAGALAPLRSALWALVSAAAGSEV